MINLVKTNTTVSLDIEVKEKAVEFLRKKNKSLSEEVNEHLKEIVEKEVKS